MRRPSELSKLTTQVTDAVATADALVRGAAIVLALSFVLSFAALVLSIVAVIR